MFRGRVLRGATRPVGRLLPLDNAQATQRGAPGGNEQGGHRLFHRGDWSVSVKGKGAKAACAFGPRCSALGGNRLPPHLIQVYANYPVSGAKFRDFSVERDWVLCTLTDRDASGSRTDGPARKVVTAR